VRPDSSSIVRWARRRRLQQAAAAVGGLAGHVSELALWREPARSTEEIVQVGPRL
jgi:hypothetical protein